MSINNFKNPWAEGGEFHPDWLGGEKLFGVEQKNNNHISLTALQKAELTATVMAESNRGDYDQREIVWVYINLIRKHGFSSGMNNSSAYKGKNDWFKAFMVALGEGEKYRSEKISKNTQKWMQVQDGRTTRTARNIGEYVDKNEYFRIQAKEKLLKMNDFVLTALNNQDSNPYPDFTGQGYYQDLNNVNNMGDYWHSIRQYYILWQEGKVKGTYMKVLGSGISATFIFDTDRILQYFDKNPDKIPKDLNKIPKLHGTSILY